MQYKRASTIRCAIGMYQCKDVAMKYFSPGNKKNMVEWKIDNNDS